MLSKTLALTSVAALAGQSLAYNPHRRHQHVDKRAVEVVFETTFTTVTVIDDCTSTVTQGATPTAHSVLSSGPSSGPSSAAAPIQPALVVSDTTSSRAHRHTSSPTVAVSDSTSSAAQSSSTTAPPPRHHTTEAPASTAAPARTHSKSPKPPASTAPAYQKSTTQAFGKKGVAYNSGSLANTFVSQCTDCSWAYNWNWDPSGLGSGVTYIPMLWGPGVEHTQGWEQAVNTAQGNGATTIFSFNEPDMPSQSNMDPLTAAQKYVQYVNQFAGQMTLVGPSVSNSGASNQGVGWMKEFISHCNDLGCHIDACNTHWYSGAEWIDTLFTQIQQISDACGGKPVYLTEFAPTGASDADIAAFLQAAIPRLEADANVAGYSYFMVSDGNLMADDNTLSSYGKVYAGSS